MMESFDIFSIPLSAVFKEANALRLHREEVSVPSLPCVTIPPQTHQEQKYLKNKKNVSLWSNGASLNSLGFSWVYTFWPECDTSEMLPCSSQRNACAMFAAAWRQWYVPNVREQDLKGRQNTGTNKSETQCSYLTTLCVHLNFQPPTLHSLTLFCFLFFPPKATQMTSL